MLLICTMSKVDLLYMLEVNDYVIDHDYVRKACLYICWNMYTWYEYVEYVYLIWIRGICTLDMNMWNMYTWYEYVEYVQWIWMWCDSWSIVWYVNLHDVKMWLWYMWKDMKLMSMRLDEWYMHDMRFMHHMTDSKERTWKDMNMFDCAFAYDLKGC